MVARSQSKRARCVCGCGFPAGKTEGSIFKQGHDGRLRGFIVRNAPALECVDWCRVPVNFHKDLFRSQVKRYRRDNGCTE